MYNPDDPKSVEKYSSAVTLSDMEVFIFPELMLSLVLANIMSPRLWEWRNDPWFEKMPRLSPYRRILRLKQYIMDNFAFNLDLDTWGLTTKETELERFADFIDETVLKQSNALFGYEGDKYYFDMDIRRHFGLDKYDAEVIPYWKTETLEAMEAFRHKEGYPTGAGECVSLSSLYASALFVVGGLPLKDIYMMATPLHSQNFVDVGDGIITNNRRIVTKNMWFNGVELSAKARRAIENERVTIVAHNTGHIHVIYDEATIDPALYRTFTDRLRGFLVTDIDFEILTNFLRQKRELQPCFQIAHRCCGKPRFLPAEKAYHYEHSSKFKVGDNTGSFLIHEIDEDEFYASPLPDRIMLDEIELFFKENRISVKDSCDMNKLKEHLHHSCWNVDDVIGELLQFCKTDPRLPQENKHWIPPKPIELDGLSSREEIIAYLDSLRQSNETADLAFMAYRDMHKAPWKPFLKAALERNPVCVQGSSALDISQLYQKLTALDNSSIYDGARMGQPDEVWNYGRGDGLEKAICILNIIRRRNPQEDVRLKGDGRTVLVCREDGTEFGFVSEKNLELPREEDLSFP
jgi:hypothetical protein